MEVVSSYYVTQSQKVIFKILVLYKCLPLAEIQNLTDMYLWNTKPQLISFLTHH